MEERDTGSTFHNYMEYVSTQNGRKQIWVERYLRKASQLNSQSVDNYATF